MTTTSPMTDLELWIAKDEGLKLKPYYDIYNNLTVGYGRNLSANGISSDEALLLMRNDIATAIHDLSSYNWYNDQPTPAKEALINMCFNLGITKLLEFHDLIVALTQKNYAGAIIAIQESLWAKQVPSRCKEVIAKFQGLND